MLIMRALVAKILWTNGFCGKTEGGREGQPRGEFGQVKIYDYSAVPLLPAVV